MKVLRRVWFSEPSVLVWTLGVSDEVGPFYQLQVTSEDEGSPGGIRLYQVYKPVENLAVGLTHLSTRVEDLPAWTVPFILQIFSEEFSQVRVTRGVFSEPGGVL